jgi:dipeptidyl aminopeptidase/acylaminoacyl peptidase
MRARIATCLLLFGLTALTGCFPLEIDVNEKGELLVYRSEGFFLFNPRTRKTTPILGPGADKPAFARFHPNGREILTVVADGADGDHRFDLVSLVDGTSRTLYRSGTCCYARFSPSGRRLAVIRSASRKTVTKNADGNEQTTISNYPQLAVLDIEKKAEKPTERRFREKEVHPFVRWFADDTRLLALVQVGKDDQDRKIGQLSTIDVVTGKIEPLVSVVGNDNVFLDLCPNQRKALVMAAGVGPLDRPPNEKVDKAEQFADPKVFEIDLATKKFREIGRRSPFAIYSPSGRKILFSERDESNNGGKLVVTDADGANPKTVATDFEVCAGEMLSTPESTVLPGWIGEEEIFYFASPKVWGQNRRSMWLARASLTGKSHGLLQPYLDVAALESAEAIRNPRRDPVPSDRPFRLPGDDDD